MASASTASSHDGTITEIPFIQVNMHRAHAASAILHTKVAANPSICMLTEPCTAFKKVTQIPPNHVAVPSIALNERPRAVMFLPRNIPFVYLERLSNHDCAAALIHTSNSKILLASIYLDYNGPVVPTWLTDLMSFIDDRKIPALLSFDCNAHSQLYGPDTNGRGKIFEEFILNNGLQVENKGNSPTFHAFRRGQNIDSFIDVTLSKDIPPLFNWRVHDMTFNGSDHHTITWTLPLTLPTRPKIRPWKSAKWKVFTDHVSKYDFHVPEELTTRKVDKLLCRWYKVINEGLDKACPKRSPKLTPAEMEWYGQDQKYLRNRAKRKYFAHRQSNCPKRRKAFVRAKRAYGKSCAKARRESWRIFVEKTPNESNMAILFKIAQRRDKRNINTLLKDDGSLTEPGAETITKLTDAHFPAATQGTDPVPHDNTLSIKTSVVEESHEWIDSDMVRKSMRQFKPDKAPGPDGLKPLIFRYLPQNAIDIITLIYKACISFGFTPKKWRETKVIFLPKPGKDSYDIPKSYRPISLSNFLLKTLERLVTWQMDKDMEDYPIHHLQHGFTKGKSTESAISNTVDYIEEFLFSKQHCLGVFLDISSAFDSISIDHIRQTLLDHGGTPDMVEWYYSYLGRRFLEVELHGETVQLTTGTGFPQGGVCSAKFWLIAFDEAINIINSNGITGNGYADDCSALVGGDHPHNMVEQMQTMLERLVNWGLSCGLRFNPQKTVAVMFSRATRTFHRLVRMNGQLIPFSDTVVYLGVTLDSNLKWRPHFDNKIKKSKRLLMKMANVTRAYWGPKPKLMKWAYTGIVRPALSYAALAWAHIAEDEEVEKICRRLNRLAMNTIVKVPRSTPTRALEIILDIYPLHLHLMKEGLNTFVRLNTAIPLQWSGVYTNLTHSVSHRRYWDWIAQDTGVFGYGADVDDCCVMKPTTQFTLDTSSFVDMENSQKQLDCNVYTDGSKLDDQVGSGVYIIRQGHNLAKHCVRIPDCSTVYQAEMMAIKEAALLLQGIPDLTSIKFYVDSQAALRTFQADFIKSKLALQTIEELNKVNHEIMIFVWTKAHVGTEGNEEADKLAKEGTKLDDITHVPAPACSAKELIEKGIRSLWQKE